MQTELAAKPTASGPRFKIPDSRSGKYLVFRLGNEEFGIPVVQAREILNFKQITTLAGASRNVKGVMNLRGKIIPIVDLYAKFGLPQVSNDPRMERGASVVVVQTKHRGEAFHIGVPFDRVVEVMDLKNADVALRRARVLLQVEELLTADDINSLTS
jgi:purine-binding chemotaxis protein CheW